MIVYIPVKEPTCVQYSKISLGNLLIADKQPWCLATSKHYPTTYICIFNQTRLKKETKGLVNTDTLIILVIMSQPSPRLKVLPQKNSLDP